MASLSAALAAIDQAVPKTAEPGQRLVVAKCRGLMRGYHARWNGANYRPIGVEAVVQSDLWNPETSRKSRSFSIAGKIDVQAFEGDRYVIFDHKTTSHDIGDPNSPYWRQLVIEGQLSHYMLLEWLNGRKVELGVWDVVRKPGIKPSLLSKKEIECAIVTRDYCFGYRLTDEDVLELQHTLRETLPMYEARLAQDCTESRPQWYFQRRPFPRLDAEVIEYAKELWDHSQDLLHVRQTERHVRNSGACMQYGSPCKFLGICSGHDEPDSDNWQRKSQVHNELPLREGDGRRVLTNSRIRTFQTCRRKAYYEYDLGIEKVDDEEREALFFGNVWHAAQEAWWRSLMGSEESAE